MSSSYLNLSHKFLTSFEQQSLTGFIPGSICEMKGLQVLDLSHNNFTGTIPQCLKNISNSLLVLEMQENGLSGTISLTFTKDAALRNLHLNGNQLKAPLNDTFPRWLEILPSPRVLVLPSNRLHGSIANAGTEFPFLQLRIFDCSSNELISPLPSVYYANLKVMMSADQDRQELRYMDQGYYQDYMPVTMKGRGVLIVRILAILMTIDLSNNKFFGKFPIQWESYDHLRGLTSHINLKGHIRCFSGIFPNLNGPTCLFQSINKIYSSGNQFNAFQAKSYDGNLGLCRFLLSKLCTNSKAPRGLPVLPKGKAHALLKDLLEPRAVEIGLGCGIVLGLIMSSLKNLMSFKWIE
ncbi:hypothetical protein ACJRO7_024672 [Eucalyptus globulus]|uniref:Uncharacterized protein n=1 Tax=Eucalyptus globulus TaxID=34317 RepID=A0ABD3K8G6_EUCGL